MNRWLRIQADMLDHEFLRPKAFSKAEAWLWMLARAAWKPTTHWIGGACHDVNVGQFFCTIREVQGAFNWSSTRSVSQYFNALEKRNMIETETETGKTLVTICNYSVYQGLVNKNETESETRSDTKSKQKVNTKDTNNTNTPYTNTSSFQSDVCLEAANAAPASPTVIELPALQSKFVKITEADVAVWSEAYPAVNVRQQLSAMKAWLINNEKQRKTANGMRRFVNSWLSREQDRCGRIPSGAGPPRKTHFQETQDRARREINEALGINEDGRSTYDDGNIIDIGRANYRG